MNASIRAHRILRAMPNYRKASSVDGGLFDLEDVRLGDAVGYYQNPGDGEPIIGIFSGGIAWSDNGRSISLRFIDFYEVSLPDGKESKEIMLLMRDGMRYSLPIKGQRANFFDSLEMLRFIDRVLADISQG